MLLPIRMAGACENLYFAKGLDCLLDFIGPFGPLIGVDCGYERVVLCGPTPSSTKVVEGRKKGEGTVKDRSFLNAGRVFSIY